MQEIVRKLDAIAEPEHLRLWLVAVQGAEPFLWAGRMVGIRIAGTLWQVDDTLPAEKAQSSDEAVVLALGEVLNKKPTGTHGLHVFTKEAGPLHAFKAQDFSKWARTKNRPSYWLPLVDTIRDMKVTASRPDEGSADWLILAVLEDKARRKAKGLRRRT